ncbi:MAG: hypothetical protein HC783_02160 [Rhodobacteraceae bacterium]|nr:hypothetical protein [Paracoccaceae bacterium]
MKTLVRIATGSFASVVGFGQVVLAGNAYEAGPTVADNNSDAGVFLLLAIGALIVIKSVASPKATQDAETPVDPEKTE